MAVIIGIDPGLSGALAVLSSSWGAPSIVAAWRMPRHAGVSGPNTIDARGVRSIIDASDPDKVVIENQRCVPIQGAKSNLTLGAGFGKLLAVVELAGYAHTLTIIEPRVWQVGVGCAGGTLGTAKTRGEAKNAAKERARLRAVEVFGARALEPYGNHDGIIDAIMIALYGILGPQAKDDRANRGPGGHG